MKKLDLRQVTLKSLLENNKFVVVLSLVLAIFFWCSTAIKVSPINSKVITDVKVQFDLSIPTQSGLVAFSDIENETIDVTVDGKKSKLNAATKDVIIARVDCSEVNSAGTYTLPINVSVSDEYVNDFTISNPSKNNVRVWFDSLSESTANIETEILGVSKIPDGYIMGEPALSTDVVTYSGPTQAVNQVVKIVARATIPDGIQEAVTLEPQVVALDENGSEVNNIEFEYGSQSKLSMVIPILKVAVLPVGVTFLNTPSGFTEDAFSITYSPSTLAIAASTSYLNSVSKLPIGTIDFADLRPGVNTIPFNLTELGLKDVTVTDTSVNSVNVTIDLSGYSVKELSVGQSNIQLTNAPEGYTATLITVTMDHIGVIGPAAALASVTSGDLYAVVDLTDVDTNSGYQELMLKAKVTLKNQSECWVYGHYEAHISLTKV